MMSKNKMLLIMRNLQTALDKYEVHSVLGISSSILMQWVK